MAYKKLHIDVGYIIVGYYGYQVPHSVIEISSSRVTHFEDEAGRIISYDYPMFRYDLKCDLSFGCFHILALADDCKIISFDTGADAEGDGIYWDLEHLQYSYGRDPYLNNLYR